MLAWLLAEGDSSLGHGGLGFGSTHRSLSGCCIRYPKNRNPTLIYSFIPLHGWGFGFCGFGMETRGCLLRGRAE